VPNLNSGVNPARWGAIILVALTAGALLLFNVRALQEMVRPRVDVVALVREAPDVRVGSDVWLAGVTVGRVKGVEVTKVRDTTFVALSLRLERRATTLANTGSDVRAVRHRFIGEPLVRLGAGRPGHPPLRDGDTLRGQPGPLPEELLEQAGALPRRLDLLLAEARSIQDRFDQRQPQVQRLQHQIEELTAAGAALRAQVETGALVRLLDPEEGLPARVPALHLLLDELGMAVAALVGRYGPGEESELGSRIHALQLRVQDIDGALTSLQARAAEAQGFAWRIQADTALQVALRGVQAQIDSVMDEALSIALKMFLP
jgi:hypothetical protein